MRLHSYFLSAETILTQYDGAIPFAIWLKEFFRQHKKFGSKDRKKVAQICFAYFRTGQALSKLPMQERLLAAMAIIQPDEAGLEELVKPGWRVHLHPDANRFHYFLPNPSLIFPLAEEVSNQIERTDFSLSHLVIPDLFLRIRPGRKESTLQKLKASSIVFSEEGNCLRLPNTSKIDEVIELDKDAVVQDKSSQQVLNPLQNVWKKNQFTAWDCCAASGGKTILLHDLFPKAQLTVSDIRESILHNLRNRFKRAGINQYHSFVADVSSPSFQSNKKYDVVICDAACSGSGTWGRTPEQLLFFKKEKIAYYADLQRRIAFNASKSVKENGAFVYITCSVFKEENEDVVNNILQNTALKLQSQQYIKGYTEKADTLFTALFLL